MYVIKLWLSFLEHLLYINSYAIYLMELALNYGWHNKILYGQLINMNSWVLCCGYRFIDSAQIQMIWSDSAKVILFRHLYSQYSCVLQSVSLNLGEEVSYICGGGSQEGECWRESLLLGGGTTTFSPIYGISGGRSFTLFNNIWR